MGCQGDSMTMGNNNNSSAVAPNACGKMGSFSLARQASIYSLTLEEFQHSLGGPGKSFGSMNMDELLKNIWTAEESQAMAVALGADASLLARETSLQRQGSLTVPRTLSRKTVDEVWKDIQKDTTTTDSNGIENDQQQQRQITYGEMTLEDFLIKAGVVREDNNNNNMNLGVSQFGGLDVQNRLPMSNGLALDFPERMNNGDMNNSHASAVNLSLASNDPLDAFKNCTQPQTDWFGNAQRSPMSHTNDAAVAAMYASTGVKRQGDGGIMAPGYAGLGVSPRMIAGNACQGMGMGIGMGGLGGASPGAQFHHLDSMSMGAQGGDGCTSSVSPSPYGLDSGVRNRRGGVSVDKIVERRQRRMIKNRESAARSRARKQAYTVELESEVAQLKEENRELRQQQEEMSEHRKRQFIEIMSSLSQNTIQKPRKLRRTQTGPW